MKLEKKKLKANISSHEKFRFHLVGLHIYVVMMTEKIFEPRKEKYLHKLCPPSRK